MPMFVGLKRISIALGLLAAMPMASQAQSMVPGSNQATADAVAGSLRASRALSGQRLEIQTTNGLVTLSGQVANASQKAEAIARARGVVGVSAVNDQIQVAGDRGVLPVQYQQVAMGHHGGNGGGYGGGAVMEGAPIEGAASGMVMDGPMPEGMAGGSMAPAGGNGGPNYAWPSYAPRRISRRSATRRSTPGRPGRTSARRTRTPRSPSTGVRSPSAGTTASGGSTSRSTTPGRSSPRIRSASSPIDRTAGSPGMRLQPEGRVDSLHPALGAFQARRPVGSGPTDRRRPSGRLARGGRRTWRGIYRRGWEIPHTWALLVR